MRILVYVEGPSDRDALGALLAETVDEARSLGIGITFPHLPKQDLMREVGLKAALHIAEHPSDWVFALPDLYPMSKFNGSELQHRSFGDLEALLRTRFEQEADDVGLEPDLRMQFRVHCLKHDLEALLLAAPEQLRRRLGTRDSLRNAWRRPVEDQDDGNPPKKIVKALFAKYRKRSYDGTLDAPWILERASVDEIVAACPERFAPFVEELRSLASGRGIT